MGNDTVSVRRFIESRLAVFAITVHGRSIDLCEQFAAVANQVSTPLQDGRLLSHLEPVDAVVHILRRLLGSGTEDVSALVDEAVQYCRGGRDLWIIGHGFECAPTLKALLAVLTAIRGRLASEASAGRVMALIGMTGYPVNDKDVLLGFDVWLDLPAAEIRMELPRRYVVERPAREHFARLVGRCRETGNALCRAIEELPKVVEGRRVQMADVEEAAKALLQTDFRLILATRTASDMGPDLLDILLRHRPPAPIRADQHLTPAALDRLANVGVLTWAGPQTWTWSSELHYRAAERARQVARGDPLVRVYRSGKLTVQSHSELRDELRSGGFELAVDAIAKTVWVGGRVRHKVGKGSRPFQLLDLLLSRATAGAPSVGYAEIEREVFPHIPQPDVTNVHPVMTRLRQELGPDIWDRLVENVPREGYTVSVSGLGLLYVSSLGD